MAGHKRGFHDREGPLPPSKSTIALNGMPNSQSYDISNQSDSEPHNETTSPITGRPYTSSPYQFRDNPNDTSKLDGLMNGGLGLTDGLTDTIKVRLGRSASGMPGGRNTGTSEADTWGSISSAGQPGNLFGVDEESEAASPESARGQGIVNVPVDDSCVPECGSADGGSDEKMQEDGGDGSQPMWSDLKTKAGKERKRLPLACIACRRKKIKCSGQKPSCKHCLRSRTPCVYKVTIRKAAPRTDYMAMLDKRLKRMEERIIKIIPKEGVQDTLSTGRASVRPVPSSGSISRVSGGKKTADDEAVGLETEKWAEQPHPEERAPRWPLRRTDLEENSLFYDGAEHLPSPEIQEHLAEVYFDYVYGQTYLLLHKPSFMRRLRAGKVPPVLVLAVCAVSARFSTHPKVFHEPPFLAGSNFAQPARDIVLKRYNETNLTLLMVLVLLCLHEFGTCQGGSSWMLGGMAIRMGYTLQLHREVFLDPVKNKQFDGLSATDREIRRRAIWACFMVDGFTSSGSERPMFINEEDIEVQLPINEKHFLMEIPGTTESLGGRPSKSVAAPVPHCGATDPKHCMGSGAYMVRIIALWRRVTRYLNLGGNERDSNPIWSPSSQFRVLKDQLATFKETLPASLLYTRENLSAHAADRIANQFFFMHIAYHQTVLFLHRHAIPTTPGARTPKEMPMQFVKDSALTTLSAAKAISAIISDAGDYFVVAPFIGYSVFTSSTIHIIGTFSKNAALESSSKKHLAYNVKYLTKMKRHWGTFHFLLENLKELYRKHADFSRNGSSQMTEESTSESPEILQYGDWFRLYPRGVSATDFEDPGEEIATGNEGAMSQGPNLLSVEDFFASLPSMVKEEPPEQLQLHRKHSIRSSRGGWPQPSSQTSHPNTQATKDIAQDYPPPPQLPTDNGTPAIGTLDNTYLPSPTAPLYQHPLQQAPSPAFLPVPTYEPHGDLWGAEGNTLAPDFMSETRSHWHVPYNITPPGMEGGNAGLGVNVSPGFVDFIGGGGGYGLVEHMETAPVNAMGCEISPEGGGMM